jgi:hypothetical protein
MFRKDIEQGGIHIRQATAAQEARIKIEELFNNAVYVILLSDTHGRPLLQSVPQVFDVLPPHASYAHHFSFRFIFRVLLLKFA